MSYLKGNHHEITSINDNLDERVTTSETVCDTIKQIKPIDELSGKPCPSFKHSRLEVFVQQ